MNRVLIALTALIGSALPLLIDSALKGVALLALAGVAVLSLRKAPAASRHLVWLFAVIALLGVPVLSALLPAWRVLPPWTGLTDAMSSPVLPLVINEAQPPIQPAQIAAPPPTSTTSSIVPVDGVVLAQGTAPSGLQVRDWLPLIWFAGFTLLTLRLITAYWLLRRMTKRCPEVTEGPLAAALEAARRQLALRQPVRLLIDSQKTIPMVWGVMRPRLLLPVEAWEWDERQRRSVLLHELAHIKRRDVAVQWLVQLTCALHWFNPLVWFAAWRLHIESERACDDLVLAGGVRASDYAEHLLHVATKLTPAQRTRVGALAMAHPSRLEGRLLGVLNGRLPRGGATRALAVTVAMVGIGVMVPLAMLRAKAQTADSKPSPAVEGNLITQAVKSPVNDQKSNLGSESSQQRLWWTATGRVTDTNGTPLTNVKVRAMAGTRGQTGSTSTDADGRYTLLFGSGIPMQKDSPNLQLASISVYKTGWYELNLNRQGGGAGALREVPAEDLRAFGTTPEKLFLPGKPRTIDFVMAPGARIKGRLLGTGSFPKLPPKSIRKYDTDETIDDLVELRQSPLQDWPVLLVAGEFPDNSNSFTLGLKTDANGEFSFDGLPTATNSMAINWRFQIDTRVRRRNAEPKSATFTLQGGEEAFFELEVVPDQSSIRFLRAPGAPPRREVPLHPGAEVVVSVSKDGELSLAGEVMALEVLANRLANQQRTNLATMVVISVPAGAPFEHVTKLIDALKLAGIHSFYLKTQRADSRESLLRRVQLAEEELKHLSELHRQKLVSDSEHEKAMLELEVARAELQGNRAEVGRLKLHHAEKELKRLAELHEAKLVSQQELDRAKFNVELTKAELKEDAQAVSRIRLQYAEEELKRATELRRQNLTSEQEYQQAKENVLKAVRNVQGQ